MPQIVVRQWNDALNGALSEEAVRLRCPAELYRVAVHRYPGLARIAGVRRQGTSYVLRGTCRYVLDAELILRPGDIAELPGGEYSLEVLGDNELLIVECWKLPLDSDRAG
jgi:hypothetical protein